MKCSLCGTDLIPGNNICPSCGALNMSFEQQNTPVQNTSNEQSAMETPVVHDQSAMDMPILQDQSAMETLTPSPQEVVQEQTVAEAPVQQATEVPQEQVQQAASVPQEQVAQEEQQEIIEEFVDLDAGPAEEVVATEDMAAPTLEVEQENLTQGARDISSSQNVSTYDPSQQTPTDEVEEAPKEAAINFDVPEVQEAEKDTQGMGIMEIETKTETVGQEEVPVKEKFSLKVLKRKTLPRNLVLILLLVALIIGVLLGSTMFSKQVYTPGSTSSSKKEKVPHIADGKNNTTYVGNYIYKIPDTYDYDKHEGGIVVYGVEDEFRLYIKATKGSYEYVASAKESVKRSLNNIDINVNDIKEMAVSEKPYLTIEATVGPRNRLYAITDGNNDNVFYLEIVSADNEYNYAALDLAADIINNIEYVDKYTTMEKLQYEDASQMIITAAEASQNA